MKISWIIPVFNSGNFLLEAIESITSASVEDSVSEIIIVDDCSTDSHTIQILKELKKNSEFQILHQTNNAGPAKARNVGMRHASGEWIAFLDSDDMIVPETLGERVRVIKENPEILWIAGDMAELREPNKPTHLKNFEIAKVDGTLLKNNLYRISGSNKKLVLWGMLPYLGSMMIHRDLAKKVGDIDETLIYGEDLYFCLLLSQYTDLYWINKVCLILRRYSDSLTKNFVRGAKESPRALKACLRDPRLVQIKREIRWRYAADLRQSSGVFLKYNMRLMAIKFAMRALVRGPNDYRNFLTLYKSLHR